MREYNMTMILDKDFKHIFFCRRKKEPYAGKLNIPGGKLEEGETPVEVAYSGMEEETGIKRVQVTELYRLIRFEYFNTERIVDFFVCCLLEKAEVRQELGGNELLWVDADRTDFGDCSVYAGDANILHCVMLVKANYDLIFGENR